MSFNLLRPASTAALAVLVIMATACGGSSDSPTSPTPTPTPTPTGPAVASFADAGVLGATVEVTSTCTIYRPSPFGANGATHPVVLWGNGTSFTPSAYAPLFTHLSSHGFIVAAANTPSAGDGSQMLACLDYLTTQNSTNGSAYFQKVDLAHVGATGHSQGGAGAIMAGRDSRVTVTAPIEPFIGQIAGGGVFVPASIAQQRGSMLLLSGGADATAVPSVHQQPIYTNVNVSIVWATDSLATHNEPFGTGGNFRGVLTAWFHARLLGDTSAARVFANPCSLCKTARWAVVSR